MISFCLIGVGLKELLLSDFGLRLIVQAIVGFGKKNQYIYSAMEYSQSKRIIDGIRNRLTVFLGN